MRDSQSAKLAIKDFKFGVELELGVDYEEIEEDVYLLDGWVVHDEHCGSEIVSPPLRGYNGLLSMRRQIKEIWRWFNSINFHDAGFHVHVDIQHWNLGHAKRLLMLGSIFDQAIFAIMDGVRYDNRYSHHCKYRIVDIHNCKTIADLQRLQRYERYHGINFYAFPKHGTVEFRYAMGTASWPKIYSLVSMYLRMVAFAGSDLKIPVEYNDIDVPESNPESIEAEKARLAALSRLTTGFLNTLQISGGVRDALQSMFDTNALDTNRLYDTDDDFFWERKAPVRGLKNKRKAKVN